MKINLWAKKGNVVISVLSSTKIGIAPTLTLEINNPQLVYDENTNKISIVETK